MNEILANILRRILFIKSRNVSSIYFLSTNENSHKTEVKEAPELMGGSLEINETTTRKTLQKILGINSFDAVKILLADKKLGTSNTLLIKSNFEICKQNRIRKKLILEYPYVLSEKRLSNKIEDLKQLPLSLNSSIPLVQLSERTLYSIKFNFKEFMEKLNNLSDIFQLSMDKTCDIVSKRPFLITKSSIEIEELLNIFYEQGFSKEDILKDLWVLKYSEDFILNRFKFIQEQEIGCLKTWMIRCPEETLIKHIKRESEDRNILGENSLVQYLSEKLHCSENMAKVLIRKHPQLQHKSLSKMNLMIDSLCRQGITLKQICKLPKILLHSKETTEQRLRQLNSLGKKPVSLYVLTKSQKIYLQYVENLIKSKKESINN